MINGIGNQQNTQKLDVSMPTRQSVKGLVFIFLQSIRQGVGMFWPLIPALAVQRNVLNLKIVFPIVGIVLLLLLIAHSILFYLNFYFYIQDEEFILKKGYLRKKVLSIPIERIQSVNTKQNIIQQMLDVVSLEMDTAGAVGKELKIHALEGTFAKALHELLSNKKEAVTTQEDQVETPKTDMETLILKMEPVDLLKIGISQNHLRTGLIVLAFGSQIFNQVRDIFKDEADEYSGALFSYLSSSGFVLIVFLLFVFLVASILISLVTTLVKYYDFKLLKKGNSYRVEAGIINKRNVVLAHQKIQQLNWETGPIKKLFGLFTLVFKQAVSGQNKKVKPVDAPGCLQYHLELLRHDLFGEDKLTDAIKIHSNPYYFRRLWLIMGWFPALLATPFLFSFWMFWFAALVWLLVMAGFGYLILKKSYFSITNEQVRVSSGDITHKWKQMELFKIQSVEFKQTIFQKRRSLASLKLMNASGSIRIPYIHQDLAKQIYDYLLYHTETSKQAWM